jgi:hypothetical protein
MEQGWRWLTGRRSPPSRILSQGGAGGDEAVSLPCISNFKRVREVLSKNEKMYTHHSTWKRTGERGEALSKNEKKIYTPFYVDRN